MTEAISLTEPSCGQPHTDLWLAMKNLGSMFSCYMKMLSGAARTAWLMPFCIEVSYLAIKLRAMHKRWQVYLPFHEAFDVDFKECLETVHGWLLVLRGEWPGTKVDNGYLLDIVGYEVEPIREGAGHAEIGRNVQEYCRRLDSQLCSGSLKDWEKTARMRLDGEVRRIIDEGAGRDVLKRLAVNALSALAAVLQELEDFLWSERTEEQFIVLAHRIVLRDCIDAMKSARNRVRCERSAWPAKHVNEHAVAMKEELKKLLMEDSTGAWLKDYVDLECPVLLDDACFGQFLFRYRNSLRIEDVQLIVERCHMIVELNHCIDAMPGCAGPHARTLNAEEEHVHRHLQSMAAMVDWCGGATAESIRTGIDRMLGVNWQLDGRLKEMSDLLWKMLKMRRNCDCEKSMRMTWLNIVGWCVRHSMLRGSSPALCRTFYPHCGEDDYKAIDKGRSDALQLLRNVEPLLLRFLLP